jgi:hypothetical protein
MKEVARLSIDQNLEAEKSGRQCIIFNKNQTISRYDLGRVCTSHPYFERNGVLES